MDQLSSVAALYNLSSYDVVTVTKIHKSEEAAVLESVHADHVTLTIKVISTMSIFYNMFFYRKTI